MKEYTQGVLIHFGELSLKGKNRSQFINQLVDNIEKQTGGSVIKYRDRLFLTKGKREQLSKIFGISWYSDAYLLPKDIERIEKFLIKNTEKYVEKVKTFGIFAKRSDKSFSFSSSEIATILGKTVKEKFNLEVNLNNPDLEIHVRIGDDAFVHFGKIKGLGGMPVGMSGNILSLLSGGIDSPVASYLIVKRGARADFIHFHTFKNGKGAKESKISRIARQISSYQLGAKIYLVPYWVFHKKILISKIPRGYELVLFRRFMLMFSEALAADKGYQALCTGDSLSQVASQTVENISAVYGNLSIPVFQPLIAYDKTEIIDLAKLIGTYELSIIPYSECCSILSANPRTKTKKDVVERYQNEMEFEHLIKETMNYTESLEI